MIVAAYQSSLAASYTSNVLPALREQVLRCEAIGAQLLCCAEGVVGGLADYVDAPQRVPLDVRSDAFAAAVAAVASHSVTTILGFTERGSEGAMYNSAAVVHRGALLGMYRKRHPAINRSVYSAGANLPVFTTEDFTFGILICRDSVFADDVRALSAQGATALLIPTNNGMPLSKGGAELRTVVQQTDIGIATTYSMAVIRADVAGSTANLHAIGRSQIVSRSGIIVAAAGSGEGELIVADVDVSARTQ